LKQQEVSHFQALPLLLHLDPGNSRNLLDQKSAESLHYQKATDKIELLPTFIEFNGELTGIQK